MSMYGPQGGPYPGQPQDPWQTTSQPQDPFGQSGQATDAYGTPVGGADAWGVSGPPGGAESVSPGYGGGVGYPEADGFGQPGAPGGTEQRKGAGPLISVIVALSVLLCGGGFGAIYLISQGSKDDPKPKPSASPAGQAQEPRPLSSGDDAPTAKAGDCFVNNGTDTSPVLHKVPCAANTFEVLKRIDGTSDTARCNGVEGYTHRYWIQVGRSQSSSFVLCMKILLNGPASKKA